MAAPLSYQVSDGRLAHIADGRLQADPGVLLLSSAQSPWAGFLLERHAVSSGSERRLFWPTPRLGLIARGAFRIEEHGPRGQHRFLAELDSITIWPGGHESVTLGWSGSGEIIDVEIAPASLGRLALAGPDLGAVDLAVQPGIQDRQLAALVRTMEAEVRSGCPAGRLYSESLSLTVAAYVAARYSVSPQRPSRSTGGLAPRQLSRVLDFIRANLGSDLGVAELASVAHLSPSHFTQVFRRSVGMTPHQFVMRERIAEAKRLLAAGCMSVAEVALGLGFSSQSHFHAIFRRATGISPKRYQRDG